MRIKIPNTVPSVGFSLQLHHYKHTFCQRMLKCYIFFWFYSVDDEPRLWVLVGFTFKSPSRSERANYLASGCEVKGWASCPPPTPPGWRGTWQRGPCLLCAPGSVCTINTTAKVAVGPRERCERPQPAPSSSPPASPPGPTHANAPRGTERVPGTCRYCFSSSISPLVSFLFLLGGEVCQSIRTVVQP